MNPEILQAAWTLLVTIACCFSAATELNSPRFESLPSEDVEAAIRIYDELLKTHPENANMRLARGFGLSVRQDFVAALADLEEVIRINPDSAPAYYLRGLVRQQTGHFEAALADFNRANDLNPDDSDTLVGRAYSRMLREDQAKSLPKLTTQTQFLPCDAQYPENSFTRFHSQEVAEQVLTDLNEAIRLNPDNSRAYCYRAYYWCGLGEVDQSLADSDESIRLNAEYWPVYLNRARMRALRHRWDEAVADYERLIELNPNSIEAHYERAIIFWKRELIDQALADVDAAINLAPDRYMPYKLRGMLRCQQGELVGGISDYNEALKMNPRDFEIYGQRGMARVRKGDYLKGVLDALVVDDRNPKLLWENTLEKISIQLLRDTERRLENRADDNAQDLQFAAPLRDQGVAYFVLARMDKALSSLNASIEIDQSSSLAFAIRGRIWLTKADWDRAVADFTQAIEVNPNDATLLCDRGLALLEKQEWSSACKDFDAAIEIDPSQIRAFARRGAAWQALGNLDRALADYDRVVESGPFYKRGQRTWTNSTAQQPAVQQASGNLPNNQQNQVSVRVGNMVINVNSQTTTLASNESKSPIEAGWQSAFGLPPNDSAKPNTPAVTQANGTASANQNAPAGPVGYQLRLDPDCVSVFRNRAECYVARREWHLAIADYQQLILLLNKDFMAFQRIAWLKATCPDESCRNGAEAVDYAQQALARSGKSNVKNLETIAAAYAEIADFENAVEYQTRAYDAAVTACQKEFDVRRQHFQTFALDKLLESDDDAHRPFEKNDLAEALRACEHTNWNDVRLIEKLADAYAITDQLDQAIECQQKVHELNLANRATPLLKVIDQYRDHQPYRDQTLTEPHKPMLATSFDDKHERR